MTALVLAGITCCDWFIEVVVGGCGSRGRHCKNFISPKNVSTAIFPDKGVNIFSAARMQRLLGGRRQVYPSL